MTAEFDAKDPDEVRTYALDFVDRLGAGETISTVTFLLERVTVQGSTGTALTTSGTSSIVGSVVRQVLTGGRAGETYRVRARITTSLGQTIVGSAKLEIRQGGS